MDFEKILADLQAEAAKVAEAVELERRIEEGKDAAGKVRDRLESDPQARMAAAGAGGLLLAGLLASKGGRRMIGGVAKTGIVAALGAYAYRSWQQRAAASQATSDADAQAAGEAGYIIDASADRDFAEAIVRVMVGAAHADGALDGAEQKMIAGELERSGASDEEKAMLVAPITEAELFELLSRAAKSPNHAAQLYAAGAVVAGKAGNGESAFLKRLAAHLGVDARYAAAMK